MKKKLFLLLILVMTLCILLMACNQGTNTTTSTEPEKSGEPGTTQSAVTSTEKELPKITIGWTPPDITGVFKTATDFMEAAAEDAAKYGIEVEVLSDAPTAHTDIVGQVDIVENYIQSGVDCIIISPAEVDPLIPAIKEANDAGIPVIVVNLLEPLEGVDIASYIGFDNSQAASVSAYALLDALGGPGVLGEGVKVDVPADEYLDLAKWEEIYNGFDYSSITAKIAIIEGIAGDFFSNERLSGFHEVIDKCQNIEDVATLAADWNRQKGIEAAENILQANAELDAIWAASNEMGIGAAMVAKDEGRLGDVLILTNDGTPESVDMIRAGEITAETWHGFPEWGWYGCKFAVMLALGQEIPESYDIKPRTEYAGNADEFYPNTKLDPIDWEAIIAAYNG